MVDQIKSGRWMMTLELPVDVVESLYDSCGDALNLRRVQNQSRVAGDTNAQLGFNDAANVLAAEASRQQYTFSKASEANRLLLCPPMADVALLAIQLTTQDFGLKETLRSEKTQRDYVNRGVSKTMHSKHLRQADGFAHAFDAVAWEDGKWSWDWNLYGAIAMAVDEAATQLGVADKIVWGGAWDRRLSDFGGRPELYIQETRLYAERHPGKDLIDGPHFEWRG